MISETGEELKKCSICYCIWCKKTLAQRHVLIIILFLCPIILYTQRVCLSIAIISMTSWKELVSDKICHRHNSSEQVLKIVDRQFNWDESVQSYILLSFFIGYMIGNSIVGFLLNVFGGRWVLLTGVLASSIMTILIPLLAYNLHWGFICGARVIAGIGQSPLYSSSSMLISRWILEHRKSSASTLVLTSFTIGIIIGNVGSGFIITWTKAWCYPFYIFGLTGLLWSVAFFFYIYSYPQAHPHITAQERKLLDTIPRAPKRHIPLGHMLSDLSVWMFFLGYFGSDFAVYLIVVNMPKYFTTVLGFSTAETGMILMGPPAAGAIGGVIFAIMADYIINHKYMKKITFRKLCSCIGLPMPALILLGMVFMECNAVTASILVHLAMFCQAAFYAGVGMMAVDLTLNYGGLMYGYCNVAGGLAGCIAPYLVGNIAYQNTFSQWRVVMYITATIGVVTLIPVLMFSKAERKSWDYGPDEEKPPVDNAPACKRIWSCYKPVASIL